MKIFNAAVEVKMLHDGRYVVIVDSISGEGAVYRSAGSSAEDLKDLAVKVGKLVVEAVMEGK